MPRLYARPPIQEAICELRLATDSSWDLTVPGRVYEKVGSRFPKPQQQQIQRIEIQPSIGASEPKVDVSDQLRLLTDDERTFVRLAPRSVSIHRLAPYESWEEFRPDIAITVEAVTEVVQDLSLERVGLRYINRIVIPSPTIDLEDFFEFRLELGDNLPQETNSLIVGAVFGLDEDVCRLQLADSVPESPGECAFSLDLDYSKTSPPDDFDVMSWVEHAHSQVETMFEGSIRQPLRDIFGVADDAA